VAEAKKVRAEANDLVRELLTRLDASDVRELEVTRGTLRVKVTKGTPARMFADPATMPAAPAAATPQAAGPAVVSAEPAAATTDTVTAPLTGVFYLSPSPNAPPFVQIGSVVAAGDVIGLIEAMKLFNEIRTTKNGRVRKIVAASGQLVRAHAPLIELDPA
jgi:acetyl-CoA carboxylase biotin carboxyl carrier protein